MKVARNLTKQAKKLRLCDAFSVYKTYHNRATPATRNEEIAYKNSFDEFALFFGPNQMLSGAHLKMLSKFTNRLKEMKIAVNTQ